MRTVLRILIEEERCSVTLLFLGVFFSIVAKRRLRAQPEPHPQRTVQPRAPGVHRTAYTYGFIYSAPPPAAREHTGRPRTRSRHGRVSAVICVLGRGSAGGGRAPYPAKSRETFRGPHTHTYSHYPVIRHYRTAPYLYESTHRGGVGAFGVVSLPLGLGRGSSNSSATLSLYLSHWFCSWMVLRIRVSSM